MKNQNLIIVLLITALCFSCKPKVNNELKGFGFNFEKYKITYQEVNNKAKYRDIPEMSDHNMYLKEEYEKSEINFAGYYILVASRCGTGCVARHIIDTRNGDYHELPKLEDWEGNGNLGVLSSKDYNLLITGEDGSFTKSQDYSLNSYGAWSWNEKEKTFQSENIFDETK